jgi:hypothetical protein
LLPAGWPPLAPVWIVLSLVALDLALDLFESGLKR